MIGTLVCRITVIAWMLFAFVAEQAYCPETRVRGILKRLFGNSSGAVRPTACGN